jgi:hypothetical protein
MNAFSTTISVDKLRKVMTVPRRLGFGQVIVTMTPVKSTFNPAEFRGIVKSSKKDIDRDIKSMRAGWSKRG